MKQPEHIEFDFRSVLKKAKPGQSFFIPTLNPSEYFMKLSMIAKDLGREINMKSVVEQYVMGVRVWVLR